MAGSGSSSKMKRIGKYEIKRQLAQGGFGRVFEAFDPFVGRPVAIKVLLNEGDPDTLKRFRLEATAAGNLHHANIVTIYDFGEQDGLPYLVMEFVEGETLQDVIRSQQPVPIEEKARIALRIAQGLDHAHHRGVIHRDVKPANIMIERGGNVKLMDFGIARAANQDTLRLTQTGFLVGTLQYTAPELFQSQNAQADAQTDLFAYGVVLYEFLSGQHPFGGGETASLIYRVTSTTPTPIREVCPECPELLAHIIHQALERDRSFRYTNFNELLCDLGPLVSGIERDRAAALIDQAEHLVQSGRWEDAQALVRDINELDPTNVRAKRLRNAVNEQQHQLSRRSQAQALREEGMIAFAERHFENAATAFESALELDPADQEIRERLARTRAAVENRRTTRELLDRAKQLLKQQDPTGASQTVAEILKLDSSNTDALDLLSVVREEAARVETDRKFRQQAARARNILLAGEFEQALTMLQALEAERPSSPELADLSAYIQRERETRDRRQLLQQGLARAKALLGADRPASAIQSLEALREKFPLDGEIEGLLAHARDELKIAESREKLSAIKAGVRKLLDENDYPDALNQIEEGLREFAGDSDLLEFLQEALSKKGAAEWEAKIRGSEARIQRLRTQGELTQAMQAADSAVIDLGPDPRLAKLQRELRDEKEALLRAQAIRDTEREASNLLKQHRADSAITFLRQAVSRFPESASVRDLLARAEQDAARIRRAKELDALRSQITDLIGSRQLEKAASAIEKGLLEYGDDSSLAELHSQVLEAKAGQERDQRISHALNQCEGMRRVGRFDDAMSILAQLPSEDVDRTTVVDLRRRVQTEISLLHDLKQRADVAQRLEEAERLLHEDRLADALKTLEDGRAVYPAEARFAEAIRAVKARISEKNAGSIRRVLEMAESARAKGDLAGALSSAEAGLKEHADSAELAGLVSRLKDEIRKEERGKQVAIVVGEVEALIAGKNWQAAAAKAGSAQRYLHGEPAVDALLAKIRSGQAAELEAAQRALQQVLDEAAAHENKDDLHAALDRVERGRRQIPDPRLDGAASRLRQQIQQAEWRARLNQRLAGVERELEGANFDAAILLIEAAKEEFPGEPALEHLALKASSGKRALELQRSVASVQEHLSANDLDSADRALNEASLVFPAETSLLPLKKELERLHRIRSGLDRARALLAQRRFPKAERAVRGVLALEPGHAEASDLLKAISTGESVQAARAPGGSFGRRFVWIGLGALVVVSALAVAVSLARQKRPAVESSAAQSAAAAVHSEPSRPNLAPPPVAPEVKPPAIAALRENPGKRDEGATKKGGMAGLVAAIIGNSAKRDAKSGSRLPAAKPPAPSPVASVIPASAQASAQPPVQPASQPPSQPACSPFKQYATGEPYLGRKEGAFTWTAPVQAGALPSIRISGHPLRAEPGMVRGADFPKYRVIVATPAGVLVQQSPTDCNGWSLVFENPSHLQSITIRWSVP